MSDAMTGLATGNREDKTEEREQQILTPPAMVALVRAVFDGPIELDPCAAVDEWGDVLGFVDAKRHHSGTMATHLPEDRSGLTQTWLDRTFVNPPYAELRAWLKKAVDEASVTDMPRVAVLCPVRSNRWWWRHARNVARATGAYVELDPFAFVGFEKGTLITKGKKAGQTRTSDEVVPLAMCLMCFNIDVNRVEAALFDDQPICGAVLQ